tara:strand:- start:287 stop:514 length:228 start_codon:yes stop_codon:yes gene_type:complete
MNLAYLVEYGTFVWMSFGLTTLACFLFYMRTKKTLKKYETKYALEIEKLSMDQRFKVLEKSKIANQILVAQNKIV